MKEAKKNLYYLTSIKFPNKKAHSIQIQKMCEALSKKFKVKLICKYDNDLNDHNFNHKLFKIIDINFPIKNRFYLLLFKIIYLIQLKIDKEDILFSRDPHFAFLGILKFSNIYLELHNKYLDKSNLSYYFILILSKFRKINIIFISKALFEIYKKQINFKCKTIIAHDGAELIKTKITNALNAKLKVGYCGHLYKGRGIPLLIELANYFEDIIFNIAGGLDEDLNYFKKNFKLPKNIYFHGFINHANVPEFLNKNDILIAPYEKKLGNGVKDTSEFMSPLKIFEYMSANKPIICSNHKVLNEIMNNEEALFCDPDKFIDWIKAINKFRDVTIRKYYAKNSYEKFIQSYTWESRIKKIFND